MKSYIGLATFLTASVLMTGADTSSGVTYVGHEKVADTCSKRGTLVTEGNLRVLCNHRSEPDQAEAHEKVTHVFYMLEGSVTMVTGGTLVGAKMTKPGESKGSDIQGGQARRLSKGDVIVIPAGTPHWWKEFQSFTYYGVNITK